LTIINVKVFVYDLSGRLPVISTVYVFASDLLVLVIVKVLVLESNAIKVVCVDGIDTVDGDVI
jgi:hypothetical protein